MNCSNATDVIIKLHSQLAIGQSTLSEVIGIDADGNPAETLVQKAQRVGKPTGLVSDTRMTHATPASFAASVAHRSITSIQPDCFCVFRAGNELE